jgi:hypothetical protein
MDEQLLIQALKVRATNPATRTDYADRRRRELGIPVNLNAIGQSERTIGFRLHPLHRRVLQEVV